MTEEATPPHRKTVRHYDKALQARLLTFSCFRRQPLLVDQMHRQLVAEALGRATHRHRYVLLAWVLMPEHVHILVVPWIDAPGVSKLLAAIKRPSSYRIKQVMLKKYDPRLAALTVQERPGKKAFRYWQEGPGHDRNIRSDQGILDAINYIHNNPVERGLVGQPTDWQWSSARQWAGMDYLASPPRIVRWSPLGGFAWDGPDAWFAEESDEQTKT